MPELSRNQLLAAAVLVFVVVFVGARSLAAQRAERDEPPAGRAEPRTSSAQTPGVQVSDPVAQPALVHVVGAVREPGVYRLPPGARVDDAIRRAGGAASRADLALVNLAAKVMDGQQIVVPRRGSAAAGGGGAAAAGGAAGAGAPAAPVDLNAATLEQLDTLPGVGPATAQKIVAYRTEHGGFRSVDELAQVPGIGPKKLAALRDVVRV